MEERFKRYLEEQFKKIAPTRAAMEYRKQLLVSMLDRAQDLRIKGMKDDELIYKTVILELGDFESTLRNYEDDKIKGEVRRKRITLGIAVNFAMLVIWVLAYLIVGFAAHIWHPTWLIIEGGVFVQIILPLVIACAVAHRRKQFSAVRATSAVIIAMISVLVFLFMQLVGGIQGSWMTFLAMVALIALVDAVFAFVYKSKIRWIELPVAIELIFVMAYVILGISLTSVSFWHPAWLMCLIGFVVALAEIIAVFAKRFSEKKKEAKDENTVVDEAYWTKWD